MSVTEGDARTSQDQQALLQQLSHPNMVRDLEAWKWAYPSCSENGVSKVGRCTVFLFCAFSEAAIQLIFVRRLHLLGVYLHLCASYSVHCCYTQEFFQRFPTQPMQTDTKRCHERLATFPGSGSVHH